MTVGMPLPFLLLLNVAMHCIFVNDKVFNVLVKRFYSSHQKYHY